MYAAGPSTSFVSENSWGKTMFWSLQEMHKILHLIASESNSLCDDPSTVISAVISAKLTCP